MKGGPFLQARPGWGLEAPPEDGAAPSESARHREALGEAVPQQSCVDGGFSLYSAPPLCLLCVGQFSQWPFLPFTYLPTSDTEVAGKDECYNFLDSETSAVCLNLSEIMGGSPCYLSVIFKATVMTTETVG